MTGDTPKGFFWLAVTILIWGAYMPVGKVVSQAIDPYWITGIRYAFSGLFLGVIVLWLACNPRQNKPQAQQPRNGQEVMQKLAQGFVPTLAAHFLKSSNQHSAPCTISLINTLMLATVSGSILQRTHCRI